MAYFDHYLKSEPTWLGLKLEKETKEREFLYISKFLSANKNIEILEIGPGEGILANIFLQAGYKSFDIIEPNDILREKLMQKGVRKAFNYSIPMLQEKDKSYDLIICTDVFEHLNDRIESQQFIESVNRVLRKGGIFFLLSPDYTEWKDDFYNCDFSHNNVTTVRRTMQLFSDYNLNSLSYKYTYCCFSGLSGFFIGKTIKFLTSFSNGNNPKSKVYKLRETFLRRFAIVGEKINN